MRILKIEIEEFGKLRSLTLEPAAGLTLIEGGNESGKSTLLAFLRFVFYGFPRRSGPDGEERDRRLSWQSRCAAGRLTLECEEVQYRIMRRAYLRGSAGRESLCEEMTVLRLPEGEVLSLAGETPGEYFLGLPPELYEGSLCMTQTGADRVCAPGVGEAMGDLLFMGEASFSAEDATARLERARRDLQHLKGRGGRIAELEDELSALEATLSRATEDAMRLCELRTDTERARGRAEEIRAELARTSAMLEAAEIDRTLVLFDDRTAALQEQARCRAALEREQTAAGGALPDRAFVERVATALRRALDEKARMARLSSEIEMLQGMGEDEALAEGAARIRAMGGSAAAHTFIEKKRRRARICTGMGVFFAILSLLAGLFAVWRPDLRLMAAAASGGLLLIALLWFLGAALAAAKARSLLSLVGKPRSGMLRTHLEGVLREAELRRTNGERLQAAEHERQAASEALREAEDQLHTELSAVGRAELCGSTEAITAYLEEVAHSRGAQQTALSEAAVALERAGGIVETLTRSLAGVDEAALRARRASLPVPREGGDALRGRQAMLQQALEEAEHRVLEGERAESALAATARDPAMLERERIRITEELTAARGRLAAVRMALEAMSEAADELRRSITPRLCRETERIFHAVTEGAHGKLRLSSDFSVTIEEGGVPRPLSYFSAGCRDAMHLSLRLSLLGILSGDPLPLFFDEALSRLDDDRARAVLDVILYYCEKGGQCLLFTCHDREARLLSRERGVKRFSMP